MNLYLIHSVREYPTFKDTVLQYYLKYIYHKALFIFRSYLKIYYRQNQELYNIKLASIQNVAEVSRLCPLSTPITSIKRATFVLPYYKTFFRNMVDKKFIRHTSVSSLLCQKQIHRSNDFEGFDKAILIFLTNGQFAT